MSEKKRTWEQIMLDLKKENKEREKRGEMPLSYGKYVARKETGAKW